MIQKYGWFMILSCCLRSRIVLFGSKCNGVKLYWKWTVQE